MATLAAGLLISSTSFGRQWVDDDGDFQFQSAVNCALTEFGDSIDLGWGGDFTKSQYAVIKAPGPINPGGAASGFWGNEGTAGLAQTPYAPNPIAGIIIINIPQALASFGDDKWFIGTLAMSFPPGGSDGYLCGMIAGLLIHEAGHEEVLKYLLDCIENDPALVDPPDPESACFEAITKLNAIPKLKKLIDDLNADIAPLQANVDARDSLLGELAVLQAAIPPDPTAIADKQAELAVAQHLVDEEAADLAELLAKRDGLQKILDNEIDWLNQKGEQALSTCPAGCFDPVSFPVDSSTPSPLKTP